MTRAFSSVAATPAEQQAPRPGDDIIARPDVVMDRAFTVAAPPAAVWPWIAQLGKKRADWYLPRMVERFLPRRSRAVRDIHPAWQHLAVGDIIPDYGGQDATFEVAAIEPPYALVYRSVRGRVSMTWSITLIPLPVPGSPAGEYTRVHLRLRLAPVRRPWLADTAGGFVDFLTIAGMAAGLKERVERLHRHGEPLMSPSGLGAVNSMRKTRPPGSATGWLLAGRNWISSPLRRVCMACT